MSADGRKVAFIGGAADLWVYDIESNSYERAGVAPAGLTVIQYDFPQMSADGRYVAFAAYTDLGPPIGSRRQLFVRDLEADTTTRVAVDGVPVEPRDYERISFGDDGRLISFAMYKPDQSGAWLAAVVDWKQGSAEIVSDAADVHGGPVMMSRDSKKVAWSGTDRVTRMLDRETGERFELAAPPTEYENGNHVRGVANDGTLALAGGWTTITTLEPPDRVQMLSVSPSSVRQGEAVAAVVKGHNFRDGLTIQSTNPAVQLTLDHIVDDATAVITMSASVDAEIGSSDLVASIDSCSDRVPLPVTSGSPTIDAAAAPVVAGAPTTETVTITGDNLDGPLSASSAPGVTIAGVRSIDRTHAELDVGIDPAVVEEGWLPLTITNGLGVTATVSEGIVYRSELGEFTPIDPARIVDTRINRGLSGAFGPDQSRQLKVAGWAGIIPSSGVTAVVANVTVTEPSQPSYLTVYPGGEARPLASNLNFVAGQTVPNLVTARLSASGELSIYNNSGSVHVIVDIVGWYSDRDGAQGSRFNPVVPTRLVDTRDFGQPIPPGWVVDLFVADGDLVPEGAAAVMLNVTVVGASDPGYLTVWGGDYAQPLASNLNFVRGETRPNAVVTRVADDGWISFYNSSGNTHVIVDLVGWFDDDGEPIPVGDTFHAASPQRIVDSRVGLQANGPIGPDGTLTFDVRGRGGVPADAKSVVMNVTAVGPSAPTFLTVWPSGEDRPLASSLNVLTGETAPNMVVMGIGADGKVSIYNAAGAVHVVVDVLGWYG